MANAFFLAQHLYCTGHDASDRVHIDSTLDALPPHVGETLIQSHVVGFDNDLLLCFATCSCRRCAGRMVRTKLTASMDARGTRVLSKALTNLNTVITRWDWFVCFWSLLLKQQNTENSPLMKRHTFCDERRKTCGASPVVGLRRLTHVRFVCVPHRGGIHGDRTRIVFP